MRPCNRPALLTSSVRIAHQSCHRECSMAQGATRSGLTPASVAARSVSDACPEPGRRACPEQGRREAIPSSAPGTSSLAWTPSPMSLGNPARYSQDQRMTIEDSMPARLLKRRKTRSKPGTRESRTCPGCFLASGSLDMCVAISQGWYVAIVAPGSGCRRRSHPTRDDASDYEPDERRAYHPTRKGLDSDSSPWRQPRTKR